MRWIILLVAGISFSGNSTLSLVGAGEKGYCIIVASNAPASEHYAAEELQNYIEKTTGTKLPLLSDAERAGPREILLGDNAHLRKLRPQIDFNQIGTDGFILQTEGDRLIIAGGKPRGTLYGVYELLEQHLGVRWFTPDVESVPRTNGLTLAEIKV